MYSTAFVSYRHERSGLDLYLVRRTVTIILTVRNKGRECKDMKGIQAIGNFLEVASVVAFALLSAALIAIEVMV